MEGVFERVFRLCVDGVNLQHFNRNHLVDTDYVQFTLEHTDFTDYVFSSRNVKYSDLNFNALVRGVTNWLNNLAQSNRQMDIDHDWSISLQVSSTSNVHRGFGDPPLNVDDDFVPHIQQDLNGSSTISVPPLIESLHPYVLPGDSVEEERLLFGDVSDEEDDGVNCSDDDDDYFDEDNGTCNVLQNNIALNVFLDNELMSSSSLKDYYKLADISNTSLCGECLLISL